MVLARQAMGRGIGQHLPQHAAQRVAGQHIISDMIGRHGGPVAFPKPDPVGPTRQAAIVPRLTGEQESPPGKK
ncbi:hypothetical protein GCM10007858_25480 [Bradyrhizobium liaoningense]|nr:hypothetical protein GCM10007858_25480 [Bradyrhizobium liaoningense]